MGRTKGRPAGQTRQLALAAAGKVIHSQGMAATLDAIAAEAGLSKGGLVYHFPSKDALLVALAVGLIDDFRAAVQRHLDPADTKTGRLARAYVVANLDPRELDCEARERYLLLAQLISLPAVAELATADQRRWEAELAADGLPADVLAVVVAAADGLSSSVMWGPGPSQADVDRLRRVLVAMIDDVSS